MKNAAKTVSDLGCLAGAARNIPVTGLAVDSRAVRPGYLFAALPGLQVHGADYISAALALGATSILTDAAGVQRAGSTLDSGAPGARLRYVRAAVAARQCSLCARLSRDAGVRPLVRRLRGL